MQEVVRQVVAIHAMRGEFHQLLKSLAYLLRDFTRQISGSLTGAFPVKVVFEYKSSSPA